MYAAPTVYHLYGHLRDPQPTVDCATHSASCIPPSSCSFSCFLLIPVVSPAPMQMSISLFELRLALLASLITLTPCQHHSHLKTAHLCCHPTLRSLCLHPLVPPQSLHSPLASLSLLHPLNDTTPLTLSRDNFSSLKPIPECSISTLFTQYPAQRQLDHYSILFSSPQPETLSHRPSNSHSSCSPPLWLLHLGNDPRRP